jgi:hypothetical protein
MPGARAGLWTATTCCSIAPKIEWLCSSRISIRTLSPACMKGVEGAPLRIVSIMRSSAMHE